GLRKVARLIDIATSADSNVISQQLQRDDRKYWRSEIACVRDFDYVIGDLSSFVIAFGYNRDHDAVPRLHLNHVRKSLLIAKLRRRAVLVASADYNNRQVLIDERVRTVLHFACGIAFGVNVGNLFELQRAFERDWIIDAAAEVEKIVRTMKLARELLDLLIAAEQSFHLDRQTVQRSNVLE